MSQLTKEEFWNSLKQPYYIETIDDIKDQLEIALMFYLRSPNDDITRAQVASSASHVMERAKANRAIYDYKVTCDTTNNTPDNIDAGELHCDVVLQPRKAISYINISTKLTLV